MSEEELRNELSVLKERITNWIDSTSGYRVDLDKKFNRIFDKLDSLRCGIHTERMLSLREYIEQNQKRNDYQMGRVWKVLAWCCAVIVGAVLGHVFKFI